MGLNLNKAEKAIGVTAIVVIAAFFAVFSHINKKSDVRADFENDSRINYNMARPEEPFSEYSIQGREIDRYYEGLPEDAKKALVKKKKDLIQKKQAEVKKQEVVKKKLDELKKKQAQAKVNQERAKQAQTREKQLELLPEKKRLTGNTRSESQQQTGGAVYFPNQNGQAEVVQQTNQKPKKSFADWRELIFSNPTSESVTAFISAYRKSEVTETELQAMAQDLLDQQDQKLKGLGLMVLRSAPSLASLSQLVHVEASLPQSYQAYIEQTYVAYLYPQNLTYVNAALATRDRQLIVRVLNLLNVNLSRLAQGDASAFSDPRNRRSGSNSNITMSSFLSLVPTLGTLSNAQDPELAPLAQQVASYIQSSNNIAQTASENLE